MAVETTRRIASEFARADRPARSGDTALDGPGSPAASPGAPVLIFEVDAAGVPDQAAPARRCQVRLIGSVRSSQDGSGKRLAQQELSAVLVLRALTPSRLLSCVRAVTRGGAPLPPEVLCQMLPAGKAPDGAGPQLDSREYEVLRLLADGDTTREIAERLSYSERTVKNIVRGLLEKLNGRTRAHAVALAVRQGVI
jgi:DNA-binding CsgD family transcriptional regulator